MTAKQDQHGPCPLQWGDRVDHKLFGFGTIRGEPRPQFGPNLDGGPLVVPRGWCVEIEWDDPSRKPSEFGYDPSGSTIITKVSSPDAKGHAFWENEWRKRLEPVLKARDEASAYLRDAFRSHPKFARSKLDELRQREDEALRNLVSFLEEEETSKHL